jgi:hypothetical protein
MPRGRTLQSFINQIGQLKNVAPITKNKAGKAKSPVLNAVQQTAKQGPIPNYKIEHYVGMSRERAEAKRPLAIPISSPTDEQRLVGKAISIRIVGKSRKRYGIISDSETVINENGRTFKVLDAKFIDNWNIKKMRLEYDVTELVQAGATPEEISIVEFTADESGVLTYASRQYEANIEEYGDSTGYSLGRARSSIVGKYMIDSFMEGKEREEMGRIFSEANGGFHILREINLPFFLMCLSCCMGLQCKGSKMTNVALSYIVKGGTFFYGAINNSRLSEREWRRVWEAMARKKRPWKALRECEMRKLGRRDVGKGGERLIALLSAATWASSQSNVNAGDKPRPTAPMPDASKPFFGIWKAPAGASKKGIMAPMRYFSPKTAMKIGSALAKAPRAMLGKSKAGLSASVVYASPLAALGVSMVKSLSVSSMKSLFLNPGKTKAKAPSPLFSAAKRAVAARAKSAMADYILGIAASFRKAVEGIDARLKLSANGIMISILSYVTFGIRRSIELRNVSYYPYVERLGSLV